MFIVVFRKLLANLKRENIGTLFFFGLSLSFTMGGLYYYFEMGKSVKSFGDSLWWAIVTFTTVGYGDISPTTFGGRIVAIFAMLFGIGFIGTFMATMANIIIQSRGKELRGMKKVNLKGHLIICGYNKLKVERFIREFRSDNRFEKIPIVIVTDTISHHPMPDVKDIHFVKGESTDEEVLKMAGLYDASRVIVLAESNQDSASDEKTILTVLLVEEMRPEIYTSAEIISSSRKNLLAKAHCDEIVPISEISVNLLVQAQQDPGVTEVISELISNSYGNQIHKSVVDRVYHNKTFVELCMESLKNENIVFALERNKNYHVNPANDMVIEPGDEYFYISKERVK
ncbi:MAG: ion channel [Spirochaetota bacterium]|nr:ion channel [Spirochaetota bacterium]